MKIGVLAMQGAYYEHIHQLKLLHVEAKAIRYKEDICAIDGLIIPGGESTSMGRLIHDLGMKDHLQSAIKNGLPVWGTCAGMILLAKKLYNDSTTHLPLMDIEVERNAYGRQLGSFTAHKEIKGIQKGPFPMIFIRAPYIKSAGSQVSILASVNDKIVAAKEANMLVTAFHPELTEDIRMHEYFVDML